MTRINCIPVEELTREHLIAEYREIPRVVPLAHKAWLRGENPEAMPGYYVLGNGHVRFFYARLGYIRQRFFKLVNEMERRGYTCNFNDVPQEYFEMPTAWRKDWTPTHMAMDLNRKRIEKRLEESRKKSQKAQETA